VQGYLGNLEVSLQIARVTVIFSALENHNYCQGSLENIVRAPLKIIIIVWVPLKIIIIIRAPLKIIIIVWVPLTARVIRPELS
jgi:hypothetical protein